MLAVKLVQGCRLDTRYGAFTMRAIQFSDGTTHVLLVKPGPGIPLIRVQLHCLTSTAFASVLCDCSHQMTYSLTRLQRHAFGAMLYLQQEARGHGLIAKCAIIQRLNHGLSLEEAQKAAGYEKGNQNYSYVPLMLHQIPYQGPVDMLTNSATKVASLRKLGLTIRREEPLKLP